MYLHHTKQPAGRVRVTERIVEEATDDPSTGRLLAREGAEMSLADVVALGIPLEKVEPLGPAAETALAALEAGADPDEAEKLARDQERAAQSSSSVVQGETEGPKVMERLAAVKNLGISVASAVADLFDDISELVDAARDDDRHDDLVSRLQEVKGVGEATAKAIVAEFASDGGDPDGGDAPPSDTA